jgi:hypothetical protein
MADPDDEPTQPRTPSGLMAACERTASGAIRMPDTVATALAEFWRARYNALEGRVTALEQDMIDLRAGRNARNVAEIVTRNPRDPR